MPVDPVLAIVITKQLQFGYLTSGLLLDYIPTTLMLVSIRFWAPFFDRVGVLRFRVFNSAFWVGSFVCITAAMLLIQPGQSSPGGLALGILLISTVYHLWLGSPSYITK